MASVNASIAIPVSGWSGRTEVYGVQVSSAYRSVCSVAISRAIS
jgi:hypothetical protein